MEDPIIYIVDGTRTRLISPHVERGTRVNDDFFKAKVNGIEGLLTPTKIISHQRVRFFVPSNPKESLTL
jgi:hypothetical protein